MKTVYMLGGLDGWLNTMVGGKQAYESVRGVFPTAFDTREEALASPKAQYRQFVYTMTQEEIRPTEQEVTVAETPRAPKPRRRSQKNAYKVAKAILASVPVNPGNKLMWHFVNQVGNWDYLKLKARMAKALGTDLPGLWDFNDEKDYVPLLKAALRKLR